VFPSIQTFSFVGSAYTSRYVTFTGVELYSDAADADGAYTRIATLTPMQSALLARYGPSARPKDRLRPPTRSSTSATRWSPPTAGFSPAILVGQSQSAIVGALSQPDNLIGQAIVASANYLTAGICLATGQQPQSVCSSKGVRTAAQALGLGPLEGLTTPESAASVVSRPGGPPSACAPSRSARPRCRGARECGWRSRGTRPAPHRIDRSTSPCPRAEVFSSLRSAWAGGKKISA
jgi:hypothetical protein